MHQNGHKERPVSLITLNKELIKIRKPINILVTLIVNKQIPKNNVVSGSIKSLRNENKNHSITEKHKKKSKRCVKNIPK